LLDSFVQNRFIYMIERLPAKLAYLFPYVSFVPISVSKGTSNCCFTRHQRKVWKLL